MARRRRAAGAGAGAGAGPGAATNRFQFREELGGLKVMGVDFWSGVQAILPCPAPAQRPCGLGLQQERMMDWLLGGGGCGEHVDDDSDPLQS